MPIHIDSSVIARLDAADPDRMRAARLADPDIRDRLFTLYAFHAELAKVPELVSEPMMGQIRYQWWRDCVDEIYGDTNVRAHEVSTPLAEMVEQSGMSRYHLDRIIDGRERDLDPQPFANIETAIDYADATSGALAVAASFICGCDTGRDAGRAWGLTGLARSYRYYSDKILKELSFEDILKAAVTAHSEAPSPGDAMPALVYASLVPGFAKRMRKAGYDPLKDVPVFSPLAKQVGMLKSVLTARL